MDFLNHAYSQLSDLFRSMTPGARITAGLLLIVVVVSLGYLFTAQVSRADLDLTNGEPIPASHLQAMKAAFAKAGLNSYEVRGTQILIPRGQRAEYMAALVDGNAMPPNIGVRAVFGEPEKKASLFMSKDERARLKKESEQKRLSLVISKMQGIETALVFYGTETVGGFRRKKITNASATVWPTPGRQLGDLQVASIRALLAGAIPGLKPLNVTVIDGNCNRTYHVQDPAADAGSEVLAELQEKYEQAWRKKILNALAYVPGVVVTPTVVLDPERITRSRRRIIDPKAAAIPAKDQSRRSNTEGGPLAALSGLFSNAASNAPQSLGPLPTVSSREQSGASGREAMRLVSGEETEKETAGHTPTRVSVSISIPNSYFEKVWQKLNPGQPAQRPPKADPTALERIRLEESAKIQKQVATLLPPAKGVPDPLALVNVSTFPDLPIARQPDPGTREKVIAWLGQNWSTLGIVGLAAFSLLFLRSMVRSVPAPTGQGGRNVLSIRSDEDAAAAAAVLDRRARPSDGGPSLRDELGELVQEDPDTAADILKTWIGNAS